MAIKIRTSVLLALLGVSSLSFSQVGIAATVTHSYDRTAPYSGLNMCRTSSSGETLADITQPLLPSCHQETSLGDIGVTINWADSTSDAGIWRANGVGSNPGVSLGAGGNFATLWESGDTFTNNWTLTNLGGSNAAITRVVLTALGSPDMGFDTDNGTNPNHGAAGFPLQFISASNWNGALDVHYDRWNNWNGTTDIFHRMTLNFVDNLAVGSDFVFKQDTDELPLPGTLVLCLIGLAGLGIRKQQLLPSSN